MLLRESAPLRLCRDMTPSEMRSKADHCERMAERLDHPVDRHFMQQAAEQWREMARQAEARDAEARRVHAS
jgi:hypothetical protein